MKKKTRRYISDLIKVKIIKKQQFKCNKCGKQVFGFTLQLHHKDGNPMNDSLDNLEAVCVKCHSDLHHKAKFLFQSNFAGKIYSMTK
jgi:hypothetical protein